MNKKTMDERICERDEFEVWSERWRECSEGGGCDLTE